jgi:DNA-binding transcriptional LysR family regulator
MMDIFTHKGVSLERLQALAKVVRSGSIVQAAKGEPTNQSLISRQISDLEQSLGVALLDRTKKPYQPTAEARRLADSCDRFVREVEIFCAEANGLPRPITVGAGEVVIREIMIRWIGKHRKDSVTHPWVMRNLTWRKIQEGLESGLLDVGIADHLEKSYHVEVVDLVTYGYQLVLPEHVKPDNSGWNHLEKLPVIVLEGASRFRRFLADCEREHGVSLKIRGECSTYPQVVDLADATGSAFFVPEYWVSNLKERKTRTHVLPGLEKHRRTMRLGWNKNVVERRPEVAALVKALQRTK